VNRVPRSKTVEYNQPETDNPLNGAFLDIAACKLAAAYRGISIEQFFQQEPERYKQYCRIVLEE
jgi:hypothetical protein